MVREFEQEQSDKKIDNSGSQMQIGAAAAAPKGSDQPIKVSMPARSGRLKRGGGRDPFGTVMVWIISIALLFAIMRMGSGDLGPTMLEHSQFQELLRIKAEEQNFDVSATIEDRGGSVARLAGRVSDSSVISRVAEVASPSVRFSVNIPFPLDSRTVDHWNEVGISYKILERRAGFLEFIGGLWPLVFIIFLFMMLKGVHGAAGGMFGFGKSRAKQAMDNNTKTFADVAGAQEAKNELAEIVDFLKSPEKYKKLGGKIPRGVLLLGSPGTGKTLLAKAVAGEAKVPFFSMSGSDFVEMFVGVGASRVRDLFDTAKKQAPCIIFIDEIDAVGRRRGAAMGGHDEREQTLNQMLVEMDGFEENSGVIVVAATNRPDVLDPALLRAGRFDRQVVVDMPDVKGREEILKVHTKNLPLTDDVNLETIARGTPGFVGADLANLVNEAALLAARFNQEKVTMIDFEEAKDKIAMGTERKSMVLSEKERKMTAYHEAGHAICTLNCENADPLHKVTIIPRGRALGITYSVPEEDKHSYSQEYLLDRICVAMGGRAAEKIVFDNFTTGAANDIKVSTDLVRKMVCEYGMSKAGPIALGAKEEEAYLGYEAVSRNFSEKTAEEIDRLVKEIMLKQEERSIKILTENREELDRLANALIEHELLDKEEIDKILSGTGIERAKKSRDKDLAPIDMRAWADKVEISSEGENISTSRRHFDETAKKNEHIINSFDRRITEEEDIICVLEAKIAEEENKTPPDRQKIKSFLDSVKREQKKIKLYRKNIKIAEDIIFLAEGASLLLEEAAAQEAINVSQNVTRSSLRTSENPKTEDRAESDTNAAIVAEDSDEKRS